MFIPCDAMLYFYLLIGQSYYENHTNSFYQHKNWHQADYLITNENIYDLNETLESVLIKEE